MNHKTVAPIGYFAILFFLLCFALTANAQYVISGKVVDKLTKEPLAFTNIIFNNNPQSGTTSDIDGNYSFTSSKKLSSLSCSYIGYENLTLNLDLLKDTRVVILELVRSDFEIEEVVVLAGENPANRIIRKVIENRDLNNPEKISSFSYTSYNKTIVDFKPNLTDSTKTDSIRVDSMKVRMTKFLKGGYVMLMEAVSERKFVYPDKNEETVLATKVSGYKNPTFASLATEFQPFSFYNDLITILEINHLNPISNGSLKKYRYRILDTIFHNSRDTVFIISFEPIPGKNFDALKGLLYINTYKYAIQNVIAEPFDEGTVSIKMQQMYELVNDSIWFPYQLNFEMILKEYPSKKLGMSVNGKSYIENIKLFDELDPKKFAIENVVITEDANRKDSVYWNSSRPFQLTEKDRITYRTIDSLGKEANFDYMLTLAENLLRGKLPVYFLDIDFKNLGMYNDFEGYRPELGLYTNDKISRYFSVGGFFGYGLKDKEMKYGGGLSVNINKNHEVEVRAEYKNTLEEPGTSELKSFDKQVYDLRQYMAYKMDRVESKSIGLTFRVLRYAKFDLSYVESTNNWLYDYSFYLHQTNKFTNKAIKCNLRFAYKEKFVSSLGQRMSMGTPFPVVSLAYCRGISSVFGRGTTYNKFEVRIENSVTTKKFGKTDFRIEAGYIDKVVPYSLSFIGKGSYDQYISVTVPNTFQTALPYEFLSDRYVDFFFTHNFGSLLFKHGKFMPHISILHNIGYGTLSNPEIHNGIEFKTLEKVFLEAGIRIDNIIKVKVANLAYVGLGGGVFTRYGAYAYKDYADNLAVKVSMTFVTK